MKKYAITNMLKAKSLYLGLSLILWVIYMVYGFIYGGDRCYANN